MKFNLAKLKENENVLITNTDEAFVGTELANEPFSIEIKRLSRAEKIDTMSNAVTSDGKISNGEYSKALFVASIASVENMVDEHGQELSIEDGIREIIWEYGSDVLVERIKAVIQSFNEIDEKKSELLEEDLNPTPIGQ